MSVRNVGIFRRKEKLKDGSVVVLPTWWISYYPAPGQPQRRESSGSTDWNVAKRLRDKRLGELATGTYFGSGPERVTMHELFADVLEDYRRQGRASTPTVETIYRRHLTPAFGRLRAAELTTRHIERYIDTRRKEGRDRDRPVRNATINRELAMLRHALKLGAEVEPPKVLRYPKVRLLDESDNVREGLVTEKQYHAILGELPAHLQLLFACAYHWGMRSGALRQIKAAQVDLQHGVVRPAQSTSKKRIGKGLPIYGELAGRLEMALTEIKTSYPDCVWLFHDQGQRIGLFRKSWASATRKAGVPGLLFHDLRRTAVVNMDRAGIPRDVIKAITGHRTDSMFSRYRIVREEDIQDARWRMERHREGTAGTVENLSFDTAFGTARGVSGGEGPVQTRKTLN